MENNIPSTENLLDDYNSRDKTKVYTLEGPDYIITTFWKDDNPKVALPGWVHKVEDKSNYVKG